MRKERSDRIAKGVLCHEEEVNTALSRLLMALDSICQEVTDDFIENRCRSLHIVHRHLSATLLRVVHWCVLEESSLTLLHDVVLWHLKHQSILLATTGIALHLNLNGKSVIGGDGLTMEALSETLCALFDVMTVVLRCEDNSATVIGRPFCGYSPQHLSR